MPSTGGVVDSTIISMKPIDVLPTSKQSTQANQSLTINSPDEREVFNVKKKSRFGERKIEKVEFEFLLVF